MKKIYTKTTVLSGLPMALLCCLLTFSWTTSFAQSGGIINDNCIDAIALTPSASCVSVGGSVAGATQSQAGCVGTADDDVWFSFVAVDAEATVQVVGAASFDAVLQVFDGACGSLTSLACRDASGSGGTETAVLTGLTVGNTYYARVYHYFSSVSTTPSFDICVISAAPCDMSGEDGQWPFSSITPDAGGAVTTISTNQYAGSEYSVLTGINAGNYYQITHAAGAYITAREGAAAGPVVASGFSPLAFTAASAADLYVHWTVDAECTVNGTGSFLTTVQDFGLPPCDMSTEDGQWPFSTITPDAGGAVTNISTNQYAGSEYSIVAVMAGHEYAFTHAAGSYITVRNGAVAGTVLGSGYSPLVVQATTTGNVYVHWTVDDACAVNGTGSFLTTVQDLGVPPCDMASEDGLWPTGPVTPDAGGAVTNISTNQYVGSEYSVITGLVASANYEFTHAAGSYITVRQGAVDGPVLGAGYSPLQVATLTTDDLYVHWTVDEFCAVDGTGSHLTTVQFLGAACLAEAGTATAVASSVCLTNGEASVWATPNGDQVVPQGSIVINLLVDDAGNIVDAGDTPFTVAAVGQYYVHVAVLDPADIASFEVQTTLAGAIGLTIDGGGSLCASIEPNGVLVNVVVCPDNDLCENAEAIACGDVVAGSTVNGTTSALVTTGGIGVWYQFEGNGQDVTFSTCGTASFDTEITVFEGADCGSLTFVALNDDATGCSGFTSSLQVYAEAGSTYYVYVSHYSNSSTTTGTFDLSVTCNCTAEAGSLTADASEVCLVAGSTVDISATENVAPVVPGPDYTVTYVLTSNPGLIIEDVNTIPEFTVSEGGEYTIHTLVSSSTLDLSGVVFGVTAAADVVADVQANGICAALDVTGAVVTVVSPNAGTITADASPVCLVNGSAVVSATPNGDQFVPAGYVQAYALTQASDLLILDLSATASFTVSNVGDYIIHTVVYDPAVVDPTALPPGTTGFDVNALLVQGGGSVCGSLDVAGAPITVEVCGPANDECTGAVVLTQGATCVPTSGTLAGATQSEAPCSGGSAANDVWFSFEATAQSAVIDVNGSVDVDAVFEVFDGACGSLTSAGCVDNGFSAGDPESAQVDGLTIGNTYYVRVYHWTSTGTEPADASFDICVYDAPLPPANDLCANATPIACGDVVAGTNVGASEQSIPTYNAGTVGAGVWYVFTGTGGDVTLSTCDDADFDTEINVLTSPDCNQFTNVAGNDDGTDCLGFTSEITFTTVAAETYYVYVSEYSTGGGDFGTFNLTLTCDPITGINEVANADINVYPNPSNGQFVVEVNGVDADAQITVMDVAGRQVYTEGFTMNGNFRKELNLNVANGTYLLQIATVEGTVTRKIQIH